MQRSIINDKALLPLRFWLKALAWPAAAGLVVVHILWRDQAFSAEAALCAGLLSGLALLTLAYTEPRTLPALPVVLTHFYFAMGFPIFSEPILMGVAGRFRISSRAYDDAALAGLIFGLVVLVAALFVRRVGVKVGPSLTRLFSPAQGYSASDTAAARTIASFALALYFVIAFSSKGQGVLGVFGYPATLIANPAVPLSLLYWDLHERPSPAARLWFWGATGALAMAGLGTGMLGAAFAPCMAAVVLAWTVSARAHVVLVICVLGALIALNSAKHVYRALAWHGDAELGAGDRIQHWSTALEKTYASDNTEVLNKSSRATSSRLSTLPAVAHIFDWVPNKIPHAGPEQWLKTPLEYIPRAAWKDKPQHTLEYNRRYTVLFGLQNLRTMGGTSLTLPSVGEGYWRVGWLGVVVEGFLLGALIGLHLGLQASRSRATTLISLAFLVNSAPDQHIFQLISGQPQFWIAVLSVLAVANWLPGLFQGRGAASRFVGRSPGVRLDYSKPK